MHTTTLVNIPNDVSLNLSTHTASIISYLQSQMEAKNLQHLGELFEVNENGDRLFFSGSHILPRLKKLFNNDILLNHFSTTVFSKLAYSYEKTNVQSLAKHILTLFSSAFFTQPEWITYRTEQRKKTQTILNLTEEKAEEHISVIEKRIAGAFFYALSQAYIMQEEEKSHNNPQQNKKDEFLRLSNIQKKWTVFSKIVHHIHLPYNLFITDVLMLGYTTSLNDCHEQLINDDEEIEISESIDGIQNAFTQFKNTALNTTISKLDVFLLNSLHNFFNDLVFNKEKIKHSAACFSQLSLIIFSTIKTNFTLNEHLPPIAISLLTKISVYIDDKIKHSKENKNWFALCKNAHIASTSTSSRSSSTIIDKGKIDKLDSPLSVSFLKSSNSSSLSSSSSPSASSSSSLSTSLSSLPSISTDSRDPSNVSTPKKIHVKASRSLLNRSISNSADTSTIDKTLSSSPEKMSKKHLESPKTPSTHQYSASEAPFFHSNSSSPIEKKIRFDETGGDANLSSSASSLSFSPPRIDESNHSDARLSGNKRKLTREKSNRRKDHTRSHSLSTSPSSLLSHTSSSKHQNEDENKEMESPDSKKKM